MSTPTTGWKAGRKTINAHEYVINSYSCGVGTIWIIRSGCGSYQLAYEFRSRTDACNAAHAHAEAGGWPPPKPKPIDRLVFDVYADGEPCGVEAVVWGYFAHEGRIYRRDIDSAAPGYPEIYTIVQPVRLERVK